MNGKQVCFWLREIRRFLTTVSASRRLMLILGAALLLYWALLPCNNYERSTIGRLFPPGKCRYSTAHGRPMPIFFRRDSSGLHASVLNDKTTEVPDGEWLGVVLFRDLVTRRGLWALTVERRQVHIMRDEQLSPAERRAVPLAALEALRAAEAGGICSEAPWVTELLSSGRLSHERPLYFGYLQNAVSALAAAAIIGGLSIRASKAFMNLRHARARARGLCPNCRFDLCGQREPGCPECGFGRSAPSPSMPDTHILPPENHP